MYHVDFVRLGAMIESGFMRPLEIWKFLMLGLCDQWYVFTCCLWWFNVGTNTHYSLLNCICIYLMYFASWEKFAKMSLIANGLNAFHVYTHVLHAICDGMVLTQLWYICIVIYMYCIVLNFCFPKRENGYILLLLLKCVVRFWHNWIVSGCAVKRQFTTNMESTELI